MKKFLEIIRSLRHYSSHGERVELVYSPEHGSENPYWIRFLDDEEGREEDSISIYEKK